MICNGIFKYIKFTYISLNLFLVFFGYLTLSTPVLYSLKYCTHSSLNYPVKHVSFTPRPIFFFFVFFPDYFLYLILEIKWLSHSSSYLCILQSLCSLLECSCMYFFSTRKENFIINLMYLSCDFFSDLCSPTFEGRTA